MKQSNPESIPGSARVFVACLLAFAILMTPIAALAAPRPGIRPTVKTGTVPADRKEASNASVARELMPAPVPEPAPAAPIIVATMTDNRPSVDPASAKPGETINYTVTIQNTGDADATSVQFNDTVDTHTAYVANSGLLAMADAYNTIGDVQINVPAPGLLSNDLDISAGTNTGMTTTAQTVSSAQCAACNNVTINADGSFTYDPKAGFTGADSFTYTAKNAANKSASATVQITVTGRIWFINNNAGACTSNCDGRLSHPFQTLAAFQAVNDGGAGHPQDGDTIFLFENTSATAYTGPVTLRTNQKFIGQDATASLISLSGLTQPSGTDPLPVMNSANGNIVNIQSGANAINLGTGAGNANLLRGFTVGATTGAKISGSTFGTLTAGNSTTPDVTLNGAGQALSLTTGAFAATSGFVSVASTSSAVGTSGILLSAVTGTVSFGPTTISGSANEGIKITGSSVAATFGTTGVTSSGTQGISISTSTGAIAFGSTTVTNGIEGVSFTNNSAGTRTFGTLSISGTSAGGFLHSSAGGDTTITGAASISAAGNGISVGTPASGDLIDFQAATSVTSTGAAVTGIVFAGASGAELKFNTLVIQTNAGTGLSATTGGTVTVTSGTGSTINNTAQGAPAIVAANVALGVNFDAIKSSGGTNGVSLTSVTGTSTFGTTSTLSGATGATFLVNAGTASVTYSGGMTQATASQPLVSVSNGHNTGTITFQTGTLSATNGTGLQFDNADGTYNFNGTTTLNGGDAGVDILNDCAGSFTFGTGAAITSPTGIAFNVTGGAGTSTANVTYSGNITQANNASTVSVTNHNTGTITFQTGTLAASNGNGIQFNNADSTTSYNFNGTTNFTAGGDAGVDITNGSAGNFTFSSTTSITNPTGTCFNVNGSTAGITYSGNLTKSGTSSGLLVDITNETSGTITFQTGTLSSTSSNGTGIQLSNADNTVNFNGTTTLNGGNSAVDIITGSGGTITFASGTAITNPSGIAYNEDTSTATVNYNGTIGQTNAANAVKINVKSGGTTTFTKASGGQITASTSTANAVDLTGNTGGTITFTGGLGLTTTSGVAFNATGSGVTINATQDNTTIVNTISSTTGTGLSVVNSTIGASGLTFRSINVDGTDAAPTNGIVLTSTGSNAGLTVTGNGGAGTGGTIQDTSGDAILLTTTEKFSLTRMNITSNLGDGIGGSGVNGFQLANCSITSNGDSAATDESGINLAQLTGTSSGGLRPTSITNCTIQNNWEFQIQITNSSGTLTDLTMSGNVISTTAASGISANLFNFLGNTTAVMKLTLTSGSFTGNWTPASPVPGPATISGTAISAATQGTTHTVNVSGATFTNNNAGVDCSTTNSATTFSCNVSGNDFQGSRAVAINSFQNGNAPFNRTFNGTFSNNTIGTVGVANSGGYNGRGIDISNEGAITTANYTISNNQIREIGVLGSAGAEGIGVNVGLGGQATGGGATNVTITGNTIRDIRNSRALIVSDNQDPAFAPFPSICANISGNTITGTIAGQAGNGQFMRVREGSGTVRVTQAAVTTAANVAELDDANGFNDNPAGSRYSQGGSPLFSQPACTTSSAMLLLPIPAGNQDVARADFSNATIDGTAHSVVADMARATIEATATVHTERRDFSKATIVAAATVHSEPARTSASSAYATLISGAAHSMATLAGKVDSLIVPTASAEKASGNSQKSDVRLNHARSRRSINAATTNSTMAPMPVGCSANPGTICVNVGTLRPGDSVQISFSVTVNNPPNLSLLTPAPHVTTQGTVSGGNFANVSTNDPDTVAVGDTTDTPIDLFDVKFDSLTSSVNPSTPSDAVTYTATISVDTAVQTPLVGTVPTGSITFRDGGVDIGTCTNVAISGAGPWTAQCTIPGATYTGGSSHTISAKYNGDANFDQKISGDLTQTVLSCTTNPVVTKIADTNDGTCDADCSLREAIATTCPNSTITFNIPGAGPHTITLATGELSVAANVTINNNSGESVTVSGNNASRVFNINSGKTVGIIGLNITGGSAANGGGVLNDGTLSLVNSTVFSNTATADGGGIQNTATATSLTLVNTTVSSNNANGFGGGVDVLGGTVTIINSTITGNHGDNDDGGGGGAGGIRQQGGTVILHNTIVAGNVKGNVTTTPNDIEGSVNTVSSNNNLIGDAATSGGLTHGSLNNIVGNAGSGTIDINTVLNTMLATNGGPTATHALVASGPAVEAGNNDEVPADTFDLDGDANVAEQVPVDQRGVGYPRIADSSDADTTQTVDIGAYEAHPTIENIADQSTNEDTVKNVTFNLGDDTGTLITGAGGSVAATSSNATLVPNAMANLSFTGSGGSRTLQITPALNQSGMTTITVTVTATNGRQAIDTFDLTVNAQNDNPNITTNTGHTVNEGSSGNIIDNTKLAATDVDNTAAQLTFTVGTAPARGTLKNNGTPLSSGGTFTQVDINSNLITYDHDGSEPTSDSFTVTVTDGAGGSAGPATFNITVTPQNDQPTIGNNTGATFNEGSTANTITSAMLSITDPDNTPAQLVFTVGTAPVNGTLKKSGGALAGGGTFTQADINGSLITYDHNGTETTTDSFTFTVSDGAGGSIGSTAFNITITPVNDAPVVTTTVASLSYTENDPATAVDTGVTVTDIDSANLAGATVSITANFQSGEDVLSWTDNNLADSITLSGSSTAQTIILTGTDTLANYEAAVHAVKYANNSDNPSVAVRTVTFTADDGAGVNNTGSGTRNITITPQNDAPTLTTNAGLTVVNGGTGTIDNTRLKVDDVDNTAVQLIFTIGTAPVNGTLKKSGGALAGGGTFTQADVNNNLITYEHTNLASISDSFTFTYTDGTVAPIGPVTFNITTGCANSITVTSNADNGNGTLRQAISNLCDGGTIGFNIPGGGPDTITLTTGELVIDKNLTINGPTAKSLTISGNLNSRVFNVNPGKTATISSLTINNGRAAFGGGIYNQGTLTIIASTINGNASANGADNGAGNGANGGNGGGLYNSGTLNVINSTISGNNAGNGGNATGGMGLGVGGNGGNGGGIYNSGTLLLINDSISQNRAGRNGLNVNGDDTNVDLGTPGQGGGVFTTTTTAILRNTIVAGNLSTFLSHNSGAPGTNLQDSNNDGGGTVDSSSSFNLIGAIDGLSGITPGSNGNQAGSADAPLNPLFGPLQNNGGPTATYLPAQFSPAIDMGSNALATDQNSVALTTDQRGTGFPRILNGTVDIGAVETTPPPPPPPSADVGVTKLANVNESLADRDIVYTITVINAGPDAAASVELNDTLPGNLTFVSLSAPGGWSCTTPAVGSGGLVKCTIASLAAGSNVGFTLTVHIPSGTAGGTSYHNVATVSTTTADPNNVNDSYPADVTVVTCLTNPNVTSNADSGAGSLRQAIIDACDGSTIGFDAGLVSPIVLTSDDLEINKNLTIQGPGANLLTVMRSAAGGTPQFRIFGILSGMAVNISGLTINNGDAGASIGGGVINSGTLTLTASAVTGNTALAGGGVLNSTGAAMIITESTISGNTSGSGAGMSNSGTLTLYNSTISGNTGNGLDNLNGAVANLTNDTFSDNSTRGIFSQAGATTNIRNTIVVNTPGNVGDVNGAFVSAGNNLIGKGDGSTGFTNGVNNDKVGTIASPLNALLAALGSYGGSTQTHALLPGSPALDAANNCVTNAAHCGDANIPQLTTDQRGLARQSNGTVDMGAFESRGFTISATSGTPQSTIINTAFGAPLVATVSSAFGEPVSGGQITFTAPGAGASATFTGGVTTINMTLNASGQGSASATANGIVGGPYNVTASGNGVSGSAAFSLTNQKANQTINFAAITNKTFGDADFVVSPNATSGLPVSLVASGQCTVTSPSAGTVHITAAGSCTITASQGGDGTYNPAPNVQQSFTINKANQTITGFGALPDKTFGDPDFVVSPTATSGLPVSLAATLNCTVTTPSPGTVHITGAGGCTITASQAGNANFNAAPDQVRSFTTQRAATSTAVTSSVNPSDFGQSVTFTATVSSGAGTPTGTVQFKDGGANLGSPVALNGSGVAQLSTSALTSGTHTITADYAISDNFLASTGTLSGGQVVKAQPSLSIDDVSISEGNAGTKTLTFTVTLSAASNLTVTANYATANGSATEPSDYLSTNGTLTFNPGDTSKPVSVTINGDVSFEADETFTVNLSSPVNATIADNQGTGTIQNDDVLGGFISFSNVSYSVNENAGLVTVTVVRTNDTTQPVTVDYATNDTGAPTNCATLLTGMASQRCDFTVLLGTLKFAANETQKTLDIPINLDAYPEGPETFTVNLSNPTGGAVLAVPTTAIVTINDSASPTPNAIDDTNNFVRQQYRDFLNREADPAGLAFWTNNIDKCNDPLQRPAGQTLAQCIEVQRILTSAAFLLSIEFKQTGGTVREFYVAALDRPATNNMPNYIEFMRDTQAIQRGVIVGQGNWQQVLDANRTAFMNEFVLRAEFVGLYPTTDTPTQYVDKLYLHANVVPGNAQERLDAIAEFGGAPTAANAGARGRALLRITQNAAFQTREYARTFVQIEYFGYLRRNPNDLPDGNFDGYNFWVNKLNQFNGDFLQAEMVKAFLSSLEYRRRFGP